MGGGKGTGTCWEHLAFLLQTPAECPEKTGRDLDPALSKQTAGKKAHLAIPRGNVFGVVAIVEAVDAVLEFLADQSLVFPAAFCVWQPHPLAQILRIGRGCFPTVSYSTETKHREQEETKTGMLSTAATARQDMNESPAHKKGN